MLQVEVFDEIDNTLVGWLAVAASVDLIIDNRVAVGPISNMNIIRLGQIS